MMLSKVISEARRSLRFYRTKLRILNFITSTIKNAEEYTGLVYVSPPAFCVEKKCKRTGIEAERSLGRLWQ